MEDGQNSDDKIFVDNSELARASMEIKKRSEQETQTQLSGQNDLLNRILDPVEQFAGCILLTGLALSGHQDLVDILADSKGVNWWLATQSNGHSSKFALSRRVFQEQVWLFIALSNSSSRKFKVAELILPTKIIGEIHVVDWQERKNYQPQWDEEFKSFLEISQPDNLPTALVINVNSTETPTTPEIERLIKEYNLPSHTPIEIMDFSNKQGVFDVMSRLLKFFEPFC